MTCGHLRAGNGNEYDGTCAAPPRSSRSRRDGDAEVVHWTDLTGGRARRQLTGEAPTRRRSRSSPGSLPWTGTGAAQYTVDITIDNMKYITN